MKDYPLTQAEIGTIAMMVNAHDVHELIMAELTSPDNKIHSFHISGTLTDDQFVFAATFSSQKPMISYMRLDRADKREADNKEAAAIWEKRNGCCANAI